MKRTEMVLETLANVLFNHLMQLRAQESLTEFSHHECFKLHIITQRWRLKLPGSLKWKEICKVPPWDQCTQRHMEG